AQRLGLDTAALLAQTSRIVHGTTVATNALLERKTARVGMLTTEGHRDVIEMREGLKPDRYNLRMAPPPPMVPRHLRLGVRERMREDGRTEVALDTASLDAALDTLAAERVSAVAVCFLHSWRDPAHERAAAEAARTRLPDAFVTTSADVLPQIKEFERFSTTVANAAVGPVIGAYLRRLQSRLESAGYSGPLFVMLSHGGVASAAEAARLAVGTALSGPAGGVAAAVALSKAGLAPDCITFDMGGTSTDIALVQSGAPSLSPGRSVGDARIALPGLDIVTLGAGGGSIAALDRSGLLRVGPESAGAQPGPACYGRGGTEATVTDANLVLGYLDPEGLLGGAQALDREAAARAVGAVGERLGLSLEQAASGILRVVNARMADGVRVATVRRGVDPRRFTLLSFGGAAGLHISAIAAELGIARVAIPRTASVLSAWGMLNTDLRVELMRSRAQGGRIDVAALREAYAAMEKEGRERLGGFAGEVALRRSADMRYGEQVFEIDVPLDHIDWHAPDAAQAIASAFHARHRELYTYALEEQEAVLVNARLSVIGRLPPAGSESGATRSGTAPSTRRRVWLDGWTEVPVHAFAELAPGQELLGPAIVASETTSVLLRPGDRAAFDARGWLDLHVASQGG
ncbi:MAG: hydantoinase/oxoprolinase family protein, partial [Proteobacteria bacterium]|nr:hydantoinase/oxoprolinase family protein [Pseudomonadota bacterium]